MECPECSTVLPAEAVFCESCGVRVRRAAKRTEPSGEGDRRRSEAERAEARREFGRKKSLIQAMRGVLVVGAIWHTLQLVAWLGIRGAVHVDDGVHVLVTGILIGIVVACIVGAVLVVRSPFLVWLVAAAAITLWNVVYHVTLGFQLTIGVVFDVAFLVVAWAAVATAARLQRLMNENPELSFHRKPVATKRADAPELAAKRRLRANSAERWTGRLRFLGVLVVVVVAAGFTIWWAMQPSAVDARAQAFANAWNGTDAVDPKTFGSDRLGESMRVEFRKRGWQTLPKLGAMTVSGEGRRSTVEFTVDGGRVLTRWERVDRTRWQLTGVDLPPLRTTPPQPAIDAFVTAWNGDDGEALAACFAEDSRERLFGQLRRVLERRDWWTRRPPVTTPTVDTSREGRAAAKFEVDGGELAVTFEFVHPGWGITQVRLPRD